MAGRVPRNESIMVAYVIADTEIIDRTLGEQYRKLAQESIVRIPMKSPPRTEMMSPPVPT